VELYWRHLPGDTLTPGPPGGRMAEIVMPASRPGAGRRG
jgi:hypothetical protein